MVIKVLVTGSEGMIGKELCIQLRDMGFAVFRADLKLGYDLTDFNTCLCICEGMDFVFHLAGIKGSPRRTSEKPYDFIRPMLQFDTNMIEAARLCRIEKFLYTSSIAVLNPETDKYPAWAKMTAENLIGACRIQYPEQIQFCIVRPSNVYGRFDNFKAEHLMVISNLVRKAMTNWSLEVWGDGSQVRDFINAKDVARGMILTMEKMPSEPINLCSGKGYSIKEVVEIIEFFSNVTEVRFGETPSLGAQVRLMPSNGNLIGFSPKIPLRKGIKEVIDYYRRSYEGRSNS